MSGTVSRSVAPAHVRLTPWRDPDRPPSPRDRPHEEPRGRRWCVHNRLVARQVDADTLLIRTGFDEREVLLAQHPGTFSMRPELEAHMKVLADVAGGDLAGIHAALEAAWELQRH